MRKSLCFMRPLLSHLAWLKNLLCYMIHYGTYRGAVVGLRGAVVGVRGAAVGVRGAAVGNIGIPTYVISRGAVVRQPNVPVKIKTKTFKTMRPVLIKRKSLNFLVVLVVFVMKILFLKKY